MCHIHKEYNPYCILCNPNELYDRHEYDEYDFWDEAEIGITWNYNE